MEDENLTEQRPNRGYLATVLGCYCPRCREGKLFERPLRVNLKGFMKMNKTCPVCGQFTEIEVGFYYGTGYVSYAIGVAICVASALVWWMTIGFSAQDQRAFYWLILNAVLLVVLQPWLMRFSRSLWISWFVKYDPEWQTNLPEDVSERLNEQQAGNW